MLCRAVPHVQLWLGSGAKYATSHSQPRCAEPWQHYYVPLHLECPSLVPSIPSATSSLRCKLAVVAVARLSAGQPSAKSGQSSAKSGQPSAKSSQSGGSQGVCLLSHILLYKVRFLYFLVKAIGLAALSVEADACVAQSLSLRCA